MLAISQKRVFLYESGVAFLPGAGRLSDTPGTDRKRRFVSVRGKNCFNFRMRMRRMKLLCERIQFLELKFVFVDFTLVASRCTRAGNLRVRHFVERAFVGTQAAWCAETK
jgi:hypothetical protein